MQGVGQLLFVAASGGVDGQPKQRRGKAQRLQVDLVLVVGVVQHHVAMDVVDLGHRANIAGNAGGDLRMLFAVDLEQVADLEGFAAVADEELAVLGEGALVDAEMPSLPIKGSINTLNTWATTCC